MTRRAVVDSLETRTIGPGYFAGFAREALGSTRREAMRVLKRNPSTANRRAMLRRTDRPIPTPNEPSGNIRVRRVDDVRHTR